MIEKLVCQEVLEAALKTGGDFAEIFAESTYSNNFEMTSGKVTKVTSNHTYGASIRILKGYYEVNGYTNDFSTESLLALANKLASSFTEEAQVQKVNLKTEVVQDNNPIKRAAADVSNKEKVGYMLQISEALNGYSEEITQVISGVMDEDQEVLIANSKGRFIKDRRAHTFLRVSVVASDGKSTQTAGRRVGGHAGYEAIDAHDLKAIALEAADAAITMLHADEMVGGKMTVVVHNGFGGVLLHEACVHSLEATSVAKGSSVFCGKLGEKIATDIVTAIDDGTMANEWGSLNVDDEGEPTKRNVLIENGVLKSYLVDYRNSLKMNHPVTGSSRRQNYKYSPTSRMTNTFFAPGKDKYEDIIANTKFGLFAKVMGGGSVDPSTGEFNFAVNEGYMIEDGKITKPVRGATLVGSGAEVLRNVDMIADNLALEQGFCGSSSGSIPTNVGQPTIRVQNMTVGGRG
ncbi:MAG: TldD/PmbA family protein [Bacilli bacterium]|nr:TldD/PmbA family protein [Bacilli bacterium]